MRGCPSSTPPASSSCTPRNQIIDTGMDETSCFFIDEDGQEVEHGYYFEELGFVGEPSFGGNHVAPFEGGSFPFDLSRRKVAPLDL